MTDPPFIEAQGIPIRLRTDAGENRADVTVLPVLRDGEFAAGDLSTRADERVRGALTIASARRAASPAAHLVCSAHVNCALTDVTLDDGSSSSTVSETFIVGQLRHR
jgi:hypothetical protein